MFILFFYRAFFWYCHIISNSEVGECQVRFKKDICQSPSTVLRENIILTLTLMLRLEVDILLRFVAKISTRTPLFLNIRARIKVRFKIRVRFWVKVS